MKSVAYMLGLVAALALVDQSVQAQWSLNGVKVFYNAGNVGIGTNNPAYKLEVRGPGTRVIFGYATPSSGITHAIYGQADSTEGRGVYGLANSSTGVNYGVFGKTNSNTGYAGYFAGGKNYFQGRVGIGGANPSQKLQVVGNIKVTGWVGTDSNAAVELRSKNSRVFQGKWVVDGDVQSANILGGHESNSIGAGVIGATIAGGGSTEKGSDFSNMVLANFGAVGGGESNVASGIASVVCGGQSNEASGGQSVVGGGESNTASGSHASISGGLFNTAAGQNATIGGGVFNSANGETCIIPGGLLCTASGIASFAAGNQANAAHDGAFVWADTSGIGVSSTANDQFTARCSGGVRFFNNAGVGVALAAGGNSWAALSDRNAKTNIKTIDPREVLEKLAAIPVTKWNLISQDESIQHIGPMAQDFYAAFNVGEDEKRITQTDADGVALAAIQGLHQIVKEKDSKIDQLLSDNADLHKRLAELETAVRALTEKKAAE